MDPCFRAVPQEKNPGMRRRSSELQDCSFEPSHRRPCDVSLLNVERELLCLENKKYVKEGEVLMNR